MTNLPKLEEKIYSLVPELKELTRGCKLRTDDGKEYICDGYFSDSFAGVSREEKHGVVFGKTIDVSSSDCTIIGHEIHPHHWLPLLGGDYALDGEGYLVSTVQECWDYFYDNTTDKPSGGKIQYDFKKSFSEQSPEFHEWLWNELNK